MGNCIFTHCGNNPSVEASITLSQGAFGDDVPHATIAGPVCDEHLAWLQACGGADIAPECEWGLTGFV